MTLTVAATPDASLIGVDDTTLFRTLRMFVGDRHAFAGWLETFDDTARADTVAHHSYWHPNGFAKLVLQAATDYKIRLHVWPAGEHRLGESNPHGHRWNFASTVLCGDGLLDVHYTEQPGSTYRRHAYVGGTLTLVGNADLEVCHRREVRTHQLYMVDTKIVHTVQPLGSSLVATLVVQGPPRLDAAPVYCTPNVRVDEPAEPVSAEAVRKLVRGVLNSGELCS